MKKIAVIGLGYVGLPLSIEFGKKYPTIGFDINKTRIKELKNHTDKNTQITKKDFIASKNLSFSDDINNLKDSQIYIITVPTPVDKHKNPDITFLLNASAMIGKILKKDDIVIYESTTYPTCTQKDCVPILEKNSSLKYNQDFFVGYSPERINPGDKINTLTSIKKITSGSNQIIAQEIDKLYSSIITAGTYLAPSIEVAEAAKAIENAQRDLNIAFVNELAIIFERLNIDTHEVLKAASSKWNFLKFYPGLVGGHCIGVDPYYLNYIASSVGYHTKIISSGRYINDMMPSFIAQKMIKLLIKNNIELLGAKILILGITFKENCNDIRNSKVPEVKKELEDFGANVMVYDPLAENNEVLNEYGFNLIDKSLLKTLFDGVLLGVSHQEFLKLDFTKFTHHNSVIYDLKNFLPFETTAKL